jgi:hypothetical protein
VGISGVEASTPVLPWVDYHPFLVVFWAVRLVKVRILTPGKACLEEQLELLDPRSRPDQSDRPESSTRENQVQAFWDRVSRLSEEYPAESVELLLRLPSMGLPKGPKSHLVASWFV